MSNKKLKKDVIQKKQASVEETIEALLQFRKKLHLKDLSIHDMREEGRR